MTDATQSAGAIEIFFSYAHEDEGLRGELEKHLSILKRQGVISGWHDRRIGAGREWGGEIDAHLNTAQVILLLVSADFLDSDYCWDVEVKRAMERHEAGEALVIPVILRPVVWKGAPFGKLQALPTHAKPVTTWANQDEAFEDIARGIQAVISKLKDKGALELPDQKPVWDDSEIPKGRIDYQLDYERAREELQSIFDEFPRRQAEWSSEWKKRVADVKVARRYSGPGSADRRKKAVQAVGEHLSDFAFEMRKMNTRLDEISPNLQTSARKLWEDYRDENDREAARKLRDSLEPLVIPSPELNELAEFADQLEKASRKSRDWHIASRRIGDQMRTFVETWQDIGRFSASLMEQIELWLND